MERQHLSKELTHPLIEVLKKYPKETNPIKVRKYNRQKVVIVQSHFYF
uniref:Uncharacterized protein n=1 Tax=uncultured Flavobacteriia bacterium TaxID=212695 RepID=H6RF86_9BACT|nr:hypothetical protein VIS_S18BRA80025 [uncultured Flavobacteriia bacterium]